MNASDGGTRGSVVLGFDGGWRMKSLLRLAADEAVRRETTLAIVTVAEPVVDPERSVKGMELVEERAERVARRHLAEAVESVRAAHEELPVTTHYLTEGQAQAAHDPLSSSQLLVVGAVGQYGRRAFGLESVSRILLKAAHCPVLIAPEDDPGGFDGRSRSTVVAGIGEHPSDAAVIQAAWAESFRHRCDLELVHAYHELPAETPDQGLRRAADVTARTIAEAQVPLDARASVLLTRDTPAGALSRQAEGCLLLVIGSRPGSLAGLVLGSVGREILNSLSCPMLVIPNGVADPGSQRPAGSTSGIIDLTSPAGSPLRIT